MTEKIIRRIITSLLLFLPIALFGQTPISGGDISGTWSTANSPYIIQGNCKIVDLIIEPGVVVEFEGDYDFEVTWRLQANGFHSDSIIFKPSAGNLSGWKGIKINGPIFFGTMSLSYCRIEGSSDKGTIQIEEFSPDISHCRIVNNDADGMYIKDASVKASHLVIQNNTGHGVLLDKSSFTVNNSIIAQNSLDGINSSKTDDTALLTNTVIADNGGNGIRTNGGSASVENSILYGNLNSIDGSILASYSCIEAASVYPGTGNINSDPQFKNKLYELNTESPCIDTGTDEILQSDRFFPPSLGTARNDMGAYGGPEAGEWYPPLYIVPQSYDFEQVTVDSSASVILDIYNYRDDVISAVVITFIPGSPAVFSTNKSSFSVPVSGSENIELTFTPDSVRNYSADMVILTSDQGTVSLPLSGEGIVADINLSVTALAFGDVLLGNSQILPFQIENTGNDTLRVDMELLLPEIFSIDHEQIQVDPSGESDTINVTFTPSELLYYQDSLIISSNDPDENPLVVYLTGRGRGAVIATNPDTLPFDSVAIGTSSVRTLNIFNEGNLDLIINNIESDGSDFEIMDSLFSYPLIIRPDSSVDLDIRFTPDSFGYTETQITITSNAIENEEITVPVSGIGRGADLRASSTILDFGHIPLFADSVLTMSVQNFGNERATIQNVFVENSSQDTTFSLATPEIVSPFFVDAGDDTTFSIQFEAMAVGSDSGQLVIEWDQTDETIRVALKGTGRAPVIEPSTHILNFGTVNIPFDSVQTLTIRNTGNETLLIDSLKFNGAPSDSIAFELTDTSYPLPISLAQEDSINLNLRFKPFQEDSVFSDFILISNDPRTPADTIRLSGNGKLPPLLVSDASINFGAVELYRSSQKNISLTNIGDAAITIQEIDVIQAGSDFQLIDSLYSLPIILDTAETQDITIQFSPTNREFQSAQLLIGTDTPIQPSVSVNLSGLGLAPEIGYSSDSLSFGLVLVGRETSREISISNSGNDTLFIEQLEFTGQHPDSIVFSTPGIELPVSILPDSASQISVVFSPLRDGPISARLHIVSNDPDSDSVSISLSGSGLSSAPILSLSDEEIDFGEVQVTSTEYRELLLTNIGDVELIIDSVTISDSNPDTVFYDISVFNFPVILEPDNSQTVLLQFAPNREGFETGQLDLFSNDPTVDQHVVDLSGSGVEAIPAIGVSDSNFSFDRVAITDFAEHTFYIYNHGFADLVLPPDSIYLSSGLAQPFSISDSFSSMYISPADSDSITIRFAPQNSGIFTDTLKIRSNDPNTTVTAISLSGIGYSDVAASIVFDPLLSSNSFIKNQPATISFIIDNVSEVDSAHIYLRAGGAHVFSAYSLIPHVNGQNWYHQLSGNQITERGIEYFVSVAHDFNLTQYPEAGDQAPATIHVQIPVQQFPQATKNSVYQMISIPFSTGDADMASTTMFGDDLGNYDDSQYRVFEVVNGNAYAELRNMNKPLAAGKAVWLITKEPLQLDVSNGISNTTSSDYQLELSQGWNLIATPFAFPISWSDVSSTLALRYYSGSDWEFANTLLPYQGYAVYTANDTILTVPPVEAALSKHGESPEQGWSIQISATANQFSDHNNYVGAKPDASSGIDRYDHREPLPIGDHIMLCLRKENSQDTYSTLFDQEGKNGYQFDFEVSSNISGAKSVELDAINIPDHLDWTVISYETNTNYGKRDIEITGSLARFQVVIGTSDYLSDVLARVETIPQEFELLQNYPNPFNPSTTIRYKIPESGAISVTIYDILGKKIKTLVDHEYKDPGNYRVIWQGLADSGQPVASGIYILHLKTKQAQRSVKMLLQR